MATIETPAHSPAAGSGPAGRVCPTCEGSYPEDFAVCPRDATPLVDSAARADDRLLGAVLGGTYRIARVLGQGGMARLYEAEHLRLEGSYAVKVIHEDMAKSRELLARFEREARAAARIQSEHIVRAIDVLQTPDGRPCIVTELLEGEDLQAHLDRVGKLEPAAAIAIARQVCRALEAAHAGGVVHRDLKPSNVFLCGPEDDPAVKVLDFGVAKMSDEADLTKTGALVGTLAYMAPEQAERAADAGPLSDIYSVGAVLYRMLSGVPPYGEAPAMNPLVLLLAGEPEAPRSIEPSIPVGVEAVVQRAMARDPAHRPSSARELEEELAAFAGEAAAPAPAVARGRPTEPVAPDPAAARIARRARRARPEALAVAVSSTVAAGLFAAALVAALFASQGDPRTGTERTLIAIVGIIAAVFVGAVQLRALRARWRSAPAVIHVDRIARRALGGGLLCLGTLALVGAGLRAMSSSGSAGSLAVSPLGLVLAGAAAAAAALAPRFVRRK